MKIHNYMPKLYDNNKEMINIINTEELELENNLKPNIENNFADTFIVTATEKGIEKFETLLNISANPETEELEFRRNRVILRLLSSIPFTERYLENKLDEILGKGNWDYSIDYNNYILTINSLRPGDAWYRELLDFIDRTIPCNMEYIIEIYAMSWDQIRQSFNTWQDLLNTDMTWEEVMDGEWIING